MYFGVDCSKQKLLQKNCIGTVSSKQCSVVVLPASHNILSDSILNESGHACNEGFVSLLSHIVLMLEGNSSL